MLIELSEMDERLVLCNRLGPVSTSNFTCAEPNANEQKFTLGSAHVNFDIYFGIIKTIL